MACQILLQGVADASQVLNGGVTLQTWIIFSVVLNLSAYVLRLIIRSGPLRAVKGGLIGHARQFGRLGNDQPVPTFTFILWLYYGFWSRLKAFLDLIVENSIVPAWENYPHVVGFVMIILLPVPMLWKLYHGDLGLEVALTGLCGLFWVLFLVVIFNGGLLKSPSSDTRSTGEATPAEQPDTRENPSRWERCTESLSVIQLFLRLLLLASTIIVSVFEDSLPQLSTKEMLGADRHHLDCSASTYRCLHRLDSRCAAS